MFRPVDKSKFFSHLKPQPAQDCPDKRGLTGHENYQIAFARPECFPDHCFLPVVKMLVKGRLKLIRPKCYGNDSLCPELFYVFTESVELLP